MFGEALESTGPAAVVLLARRDRVEDGLVQGEPRLAAEIGEGHGHQRRGAGITRRVVRDVGQDEPLRRGDLE